MALMSCVAEMEFSTSESEDTLYAQIEQETDSKTVMDEHNNIRWVSEDQVVAFMQRSFGDKYQINSSYVGKTSGYFSKVASSVSGGLAAGNELEHNIVYYPYSETVECEKYYSDYILKVLLPSEQTYAKESFGNGAFPMVAVSEDNDITFRNVCGGIKLQLKGFQSVSSITIEGNNNEILSGAASIRAYTDGTKPSIVMDQEAETYVRLNCGESVQLRQDIATEFIIALPPVEFTKGFKITVEDQFGNAGVIETDKSNTVYRSSLLAMPEVDIILKNIVPDNQIWYTATEQISFQDSFGGSTAISHEYNTDTHKGIITFDGAITAIGEQAFLACSALTSIIIPESVTTIGGHAFNSCYNLTNINIPESVTTIGGYAFLGCSALTSITVPESVTEIGINAFNQCYSLTSINIPKSVTTIGFSTFEGCTALTNINISEGVTSIEVSAFQGCLSLTNINLPESLTTIGGYAFLGCSALTSITIPESVTEIGINAFTACSSLVEASIKGELTAYFPFLNSCPKLARICSPISTPDNRLMVHEGKIVAAACGGLTELSIPEGVTSIEDNIFAYCPDLTSINIPESVTSIGNSAFCGCSALTNINIPEGVTSFGTGILEYCPKLKKINSPLASPDNRILIHEGKIIAVACSGLTELSIPEGVKSIEPGVFTDCSGLTNINIPESVTSIKSSAFSFCSGLTSINLPKSVTTIGDYAFLFCSNIISINIPEGVTLIGYGTFTNCSSLANINIPESVTSIRSNAFSGCSSLTSITIPEGVTSIGGATFFDCTSLKTIYLKATTPPQSIYQLFGNAPLEAIYVPMGYESSYQNAAGWSEYASYIQGYEY